MRTRPALHEAKDEAEARYYEADAEAKKLVLGRVGLEDLTSLNNIAFLWIHKIAGCRQNALKCSH